MAANISILAARFIAYPFCRSSMTRMKNRQNKFWLRGLLWAGLTLLFLLSWYHQEVYRLYKVTTLFSPAQIVANFQNASSIFPYKLVHKGESNFVFQQSRRPMLASFDYKGQSIDIARHLEQTQTTGFLVVKDDAIVYENYWHGLKPDSRHISWSLNKSFLSALIGIAIEEGFITSIDQAITDYVPELIGSGYQDVKIRHILQMSSGVKFNEDYADFYSDINRMGRVLAMGSSINEFAASLTKDYPPGSKLHYVSMDTQVLGMLLKSATKMNPADYLEQKIWKKLGMEQDATWLLDDYGMELAFGTLNVTLRDYARFGRLYQNRGNWQGEQIIPEKWVLESTRPSGPEFMPGQKTSSAITYGYGYQWWLPPEYDQDFLGRGVYGQYLYVHPEKKVVIVKLSADPDWRTGLEENLVTLKMFQAIANYLSPSSDHE